MTPVAAQPERISTGVPGCDEILDGGLVPARSHLIVGAAGAGKTIFSLQWLRDGAIKGESALYITLAEPGHEMGRNIAKFGWNLDGIEVLDLAPDGEEVGSALGEYHVFPPSEVENTPAWQAIFNAVREKRPKRLVIDSITQLRYLATDEYQFRKNILGLVNFLNLAGCTSFLVFEPGELERETSVSLAVDGIIRLRSEISSSLAIGLRSIQVEKLRGSGFMSGMHPLRIGPNGLTVFPHRVEPYGITTPGERLISSGIGELDELLGGGLESATTTLITGPTGTGKSTLGTQFLVHKAARSRAILFSFEESANFIITRSRSIGMPIDQALETNALKIVRINPIELYPDEFLAHVRKAVEEDGCRMVMIDSLRGYQLAMEEFGKPQAHIHNLVSYLSRQGVATLLINETECITSNSLMATEIGVSHLADNIVLLRYAESAGQIIKVVGCLKKRTGRFQPELRNMQITSSGIKVSKKLEHLQGILTGAPTFSPVN